MPTVFVYLAAILIGYLLGCSNMAYFISRAKGFDIRKAGSGNLGASNAMVTMGWSVGILVAIHDILKSLLAVVIVRALFGTLPFVGAVAGIACVMGHMFPFYLKFRGGKGFASYFGMMLALDWKFALVLAVLAVVITLVTDYIVLATMTTIVVSPIYLGFMSRSWVAAAILCVGSAAMIWKHRENFRRLRNGTEIGIRRANKGTDRVA